MSTKDQDDYDAFCQLQPATRWNVYKLERDRADKAEARIEIILKAVKDAGCNIDFDHPDGPYMEMH